PCASGKKAQEIERSGKLPDAREVMLDDEHAVIAELFGVEHVVDVLAVAQAVADRPFARGLGSAEQSKLHVVILLPRSSPQDPTPPILTPRSPRKIFWQDPLARSSGKILWQDPLARSSGPGSARAEVFRPQFFARSFSPEVLPGNCRPETVG